MSAANRKVTIVEVAAAAGVSFGTVSRVINGDAHVRPETRQRVLEAMRALHFTANRQARRLAGGRSNSVGVLVPDLGTGYIGEIVRGIDTELSLSGYDLILYTTHRAPAKEAEYVANLVQDMVDGLLLVLPRSPTDYLSTLAQRGFPFVLIDHQGMGADCAAVGAANWQGAYNAADALIRMGHRRIGFITGALDLGAAVDRLDGFQTALRAHHIPYEPELIYPGTFHQTDGYTGACHFLDLTQPPTLIFASNDVMAMAAMDAVRERGLRVPEDISVVGFDDIPQASLVRPALSTVRQPLEQMGRMAVQMLMEIFRDPGVPPRRIELPTELILRDSTAPPKAQQP